MRACWDRCHRAMLPSPQRGGDAERVWRAIPYWAISEGWSSLSMGEQDRWRLGKKMSPPRKHKIEDPWEKTIVPTLFPNAYRISNEQCATASNHSVRPCRNGLEKIPELADSYRMPQFVKCSFFYLPDPFPADAERPADLIESVSVTVVETESQADDLRLAFRQTIKNFIDSLQKLSLGGFILGGFNLLIFDEISQVAVFCPNGCFQ